MWRNFILSLLGLALISIAAPAGADNTNGMCNKTIAVAVGAGFKVVHGIGNHASNCAAVTASLLAFANPEGDCIGPYTTGDLAGIFVASNAPFDGTISPLGTAICTSLFLCGLGPFLPDNVCPDFSLPD